MASPNEPFALDRKRPAWQMGEMRATRNGSGAEARGPHARWAAATALLSLAGRLHAWVGAQAGPGGSQEAA